LIERSNPYSQAIDDFSLKDEPAHPYDATYWTYSFPEFELKPNFTQKFDGAVIKLSEITTIKTNNDGFRDNKDYEINKSPDIVRIIFLGDSYTFGWGVNIEDSWPKVVERLLNENSDNKTYEVFNLGVPGYNTAQEVTLYKNKGLKYDPDMVLIHVFSNDLSNFTEEELEAKKYKQELNLKKLPEYEIERLVWEKKAEILNRYLINMSLYWENIDNPLKELKEISGNKTVIILDIENPTDFSNKLETNSKELGINYLKIKVKYTKIHPLDHHPDKDTYKRIGESIYKEITPIIDKLEKT